MTVKIRRTKGTPSAPIEEENGRQAIVEPRSEAGLWVSEEVYWERYYEESDFHYEWNDGVLEEKPVSDYANLVLYQWFLVLLRAFLTTNPIAKLVNMEMAFRLALPHKTTIRKPDLFIVRNDNPAPLADRDRSYKGVCDLAIELLSDSTPQEVERDTVQKYAEYEGIGVQEYFILHTEEEHRAFYRLASNGRYAPIQPSEEGVISSEVLPGFQFRIRDLLRQPALIEMAEDPVYRHFVLPEFLAVKRQAAAERARAERLAAKLRSLDVEIEDM